MPLDRCPCCNAQRGRHALKLIAGTVISACLTGASDSSPLDPVHVDPATGHYVDNHGRVRIFHGVNIVYKEPPWYPPSGKFTTTDSLDKQTMELLREWGFNVVRLGVMWPGVEPAPGVVDHGYLDALGALMRGLADHGVYTLADLHQDLGSRRFCGEGFPEHYVDALLRDPGSRLAKAGAFPAPLGGASSMPLNASGFPALSDCLRHQFSDFYGTYQVGALFETLYTPGTELRKGFVRFWAAVASAFKEAPHVLGYELLNEPSASCLEESFLDCQTGFLPGVVSDSTEKKKLAPLYREAARAIRAAGAPQPILYEATVAPKVVPVFPEPPLENETQQGLAYHIYCQPGDGDGVAQGLICKAAQALFEGDYYKFLRKHVGTAGFMTEFGAVDGNKAELAHLDSLLATSDELFQSWAYWQLKTYKDFTTANAAESMYGDDGSLKVQKLKTLSRTYAPAIGGRPSRMAFDPATGTFELDFNATVQGAPTEVYLNEDLHYRNGYVLTAEPRECLEVTKPGRNRVHIFLRAKQPCQGSAVRVRLAAAAQALPAEEKPIVV